MVIRIGSSRGLKMLVCCLMTLLASSGCHQSCGNVPRNFRIAGDGGFWDSDKHRSDPDEIAEYCKALYRPALEETKKPETRFELPEIEITSGVLSLSGGKIELGENSTTKYMQLGAVDLAVVQFGMAQCSSAQRTYECVVFVNPKDQPEAEKASYLTEMLVASNNIRKAAKDFNEASTPAERKQAEERIRNTVDGVSSPPKDLPVGPDPVESNIRSLDKKQAEHSSLLDTEQRKTDGLLQEVTYLRNNIDRLALQSQLLEAAMASSDAERTKWRSCKHAWTRELSVVRELRKEIRQILSDSAPFGSDSLYSPLSATVEQAGFGVCDTVVGSAMSDKLTRVRQALSVVARKRATRTVFVRIDGFSDQQPIIPDENRDKCKQHGFNNITLAENRARAVWQALITASPEDLPGLEKPVIIGHDDQFLCDCSSHRRDFSLCPLDLNKCHEKNRRFVLALEGTAVTPDFPTECTDLQVGVTPL